MVTTGVRDFLVLLYSLEPEVNTDMAMMWGRCPDCHKMVSGANVQELVGDILGHQCLEHSNVEAH